MGGTSHVYLFGDQTGEFEPGLRCLLQTKDNSFLASFFEKCFHALRHEISRLPPSDREIFPRFTSIVHLLAQYRRTAPNPALESALTCIYQLAAFISYYGDRGHDYPQSSNSYVVGLCTGLLASAAVASSQNVGQLLPLAVEAVVVSLRLGLCSLKFRDLVGPGDSQSPSWSAVVTGVQEDEAEAAICDFSRKKGLSPSTRPYISAVNPNCLTISGPPSTLEEFIDNHINNAKPFRVAVHAPFHAPHLYGMADIDWILDTRYSDTNSLCESRIPLLSSATGNQIMATSFRDLLRIALEEILLRKLRWDKVLHKCGSVLGRASTSKCIVIPVATATASGLLSTLKRAGLEDVSLGNDLMKFPSENGNINCTGRPEKSKIAIIGFSGRFPEAPTIEHLWDLLYRGLDVHKEVPPDRWDWKTHVDLTGKKRNTSQVPYGCWVNEPGLFDPRFFNMSPREALQADPGQRLALMTAYEAMEMAGLVPDSTQSTQRDRVGIFYGMTSDDYREVNSGQDIDTYFIPGGNRAFTPGRINYYFKFSGPSVSVDTACSSSLAAIHMACNSLWRNDCDTAIAGGTNILTNPDNHAGLDRGHFLSRKGNCNTFDDGADGYCRADAVGTLVLKRLEDALADKDPIYGVIVGAYTNHSAEAVSMTRPHVGAQTYIFEKILNEANVDPHDISYIEMHGTGTQAGDAVEMNSVLGVFAPDYRRKPEQSLYLGSTKANIGHSESASGVSSVIKVLLMMRESTIPPHCGIKTKINHNFPTDLSNRNVHIAFKPTPWPRPATGERKVFVNNFSAAGGNTALLMEDAPRDSDIPDDPRSTHIVAVSARSQISLKNNIKSLVSYVAANDSGKGRGNFLAKLSYTTTARRIHHPFRVIVSGSTASEVRDALEASASRDSFSPVPSRTPSVGFVFTGQGAQYTAMGREMYDHFSQFRSDILHLNGIAQNQGFPSILPLIDGSVPIERLGPVVVQLGTTCLQIALARLWNSWGVRPAFVLGHSLGEYAALCISGVLTIVDAIYLCGRRARLLEEKCEPNTHAMLAIRASLSDITSFLDPEVHEVACINGPSEIVISGISTHIDSLSEGLSAAGIKATKLRVPFAFHSAQVESILEQLEDAASGVQFSKPAIPVVSPLLGEVITESNHGLLGAKYLRRHCRETVNFLAALEAVRYAKLIDDKTVWVEIGSHTICSTMIKSVLGPQTKTIASLRRNEDLWKVLSQSLASAYLSGLDIQWREYHHDFAACQRVLYLPAYSWDIKNYWMPYKNDFCLTKGEDAREDQNSQLANQRLTIAVQRIVESTGDGAMATVVMESDLADPLLAPVMMSHKVNGVPLCPSSLYAEIAQSLGEYLIETFKPKLRGSGFDVCNVSVPKPLIFNSAGPQLFRASATANWIEKSATIQIYSVSSDGKKIAEHCSCLVKFSDCSTWEDEWKRIAYLIRRSIDRLHETAAAGKSHRLGNGMAYKLFRALVEYGPEYKSMQEIILDSEQYEATARVKFQAEPANFHRNPYWIDSFGQLSGFVMNANDATDSQNIVFVNHGWDSMRCLKKFSADVTYRTYVKMQPWRGTIYAGDVYVFEDEDIIAVYGGVKFQGIPRQILNTVLPPVGSGAKSVPSKPTPIHAKARVTKQIPAPELPKQDVKGTGSNLLARALAILAEEIGVAQSELSDGLVFADYGVDSLLSLTITGKFREELNIDLESTVFMDHPTVKDFKRVMMQQTAAIPSDSSESSAVSSTFEDTGSSTMPSTPGTPGGFVALTDKDAQSVHNNNTLVIIRQTIAEEIGVSPDELAGNVNIGELGMDSLMSLTVLGKLRETLELDLPSEFFIEHQTLDAIEKALDLKPKPAVESLTPLLDPAQCALEPDLQKQSQSSHPPATSILLQGNPKTATHTLFLFPDGSGSSTSYATIPKISPDVCVYGLNCPYMKVPEKLTCALQDLTAPYVAEIRRRQPKGPYNLGGWSAGGICAYDASKRLVIEEGETVERLLLLDSPFPIGLEKLPPRLYKFFDSMKIFGDGKTPPPDWLLPHFLAFIDALDKYEATPFPSTDPRYKSRLPRAYLFWAKDGVCGKPGDPRPEPAPDGSQDPREMLWLLNDRTDFGPNGWDTLVGKEKVAMIEAMPGVNHFTMMNGQKAKGLSRFIERAFQ